MVRLRAAGLALALVLFAACAAATYDTHDDLTVSTQVKIALLDDAGVGAFRLNAATSRGVVTLTGTVPSQADADHAIAIARNVRGVRQVKSELRVGGFQLPASSFQLPASAFQIPDPRSLPILGDDSIARHAE